MRAARLSVLLAPLAVAALQLPHIPTPQEALATADSFLHAAHGAGQPASHVLSYANDVTLASVPGDEHLVLTSASHPEKKMRIKSHHGWCEPDARSFSGYFDVGYGKELFFYFFESRSNPKEDPVVMWINGGPGCSSSMGLFMELGPCRIKEDPKSPNDTYVNKFAWNEKANVFFLDEPIGVGFSHADNGQVVNNAHQAAKDVASFIQIFFEHFKEFEGRAFHMSGESYGGRYLPVFASEVVDQNARLQKEGKTPINLKSVIIGNGQVNFYKNFLSTYPILCTAHGGLDAPVAPIADCVQIAEDQVRCEKLIIKHCLDSTDPVSCSMAREYCSEHLDFSSVARIERNPYDVSKVCTNEQREQYLCYNETVVIRNYLDLPKVRELLGVTTKEPFQSCSRNVGSAFHYALDNVEQTWLYVASLLERGIPLLDYVGTFDLACNHFEQSLWTDALEWSGSAEFRSAPTIDWKVDGEFAGTYKAGGNLTLLKIFGAGHMVPFDKDKEASKMFNDWVAQF